MKKITHLPIAMFIPFLFLNGIAMHVSAQKSDPPSTNSFFDNDTLHALTMHDLIVEGEVKNPGKVDFSKLSLHQVVVKEVLPPEDSMSGFVGAYTYYGYPLCDILDHFELDKKNNNVFPPLTDLYIEIHNSSGEQIVISWGELYYSDHSGEIILATQVRRIVPEKTGELFPLPRQSKIVVSDDLLTIRNIDSPVKIIVRSADIHPYIEKGMTSFQGEYFTFEGLKGFTDTIFSMKGIPEQTVHTVFYGKGRGLHSTDPFTGHAAKPWLESMIHPGRADLMEGLVVFVSEDGYRAVFSLSEITNRNDQGALLILENRDHKGQGRFRLLPACDFFSDRAVKGLKKVIFITTTL